MVRLPPASGSCRPRSVADPVPDRGAAGRPGRRGRPAGRAASARPGCRGSTPAPGSRVETGTSERSACASGFSPRDSSSRRKPPVTAASATSLTVTPYAVPHGADVVERDVGPGVAAAAVERAGQRASVHRRAARRPGRAARAAEPAVRASSRPRWRSAARSRRARPAGEPARSPDRPAAKRPAATAAGRGLPGVGHAAAAARASGRARAGRGRCRRRRRPGCGAAWTAAPSGRRPAPRRTSTPTAGGCGPSAGSSPGSSAGRSPPGRRAPAARCCGRASAGRSRGSSTQAGRREVERHRAQLLPVARDQRQPAVDGLDELVERRAPDPRRPRATRSPGMPCGSTSSASRKARGQRGQTLHAGPPRGRGRAPAQPRVRRDPHQGPSVLAGQPGGTGAGHRDTGWTGAGPRRESRRHDDALAVCVRGRERPGPVGDLLGGGAGLAPYPRGAGRGRPRTAGGQPRGRCRARSDLPPGAGAEAGEEPAAPRPAPRRPGRRGGAAGGAGRPHGSRWGRGTRCPGWCWPTRRATSSASCERSTGSQPTGSRRRGLVGRPARPARGRCRAPAFRGSFGPDADPGGDKWPRGGTYWRG